MTKILRETIIKKTRKPHKCFGCMRTIPKGSEAYLQVGCNLETVHSFYLHTYCEKIIENYDWSDDSLDEGCIWPILSDLDFNGSPQEFIKYHI